MVSTDQRDTIWIADLEGQQEEERLDGVVAPIDKVTEEQVVLVGTFAADLEQLDEVVELPVDVAAYLKYIYVCVCVCSNEWCRTDGERVSKRTCYGMHM